MFKSKRLNALGVVAAAVLILVILRVRAWADDAEAIPVGTKITIQNWRQYKQFMSDGMVALFEGKYAFKMPNDVEIDVGAPIHVVRPSTYREATEKYSGQVRVVHLPNGHNDVANYVAGEPFPDPRGPDKGYEILADAWYGYGPHLGVGMPGDGMWNLWLIDRFGDYTGAKWAFVYRQLAFNTDPGVPRTEPLAAGAFASQWIMIDEPEEAKYTADLDLLPQNNQEPETNYVFVPALRRSLRISVNARCAPLLGTDWTHDDQKPGFNGGLAIFDADFLREQKVLALVNMTAAETNFPANYDMPLAFAKPSWGPWSLRSTWVINVHRIPSVAAGYCYGKRTIYIDKETAVGMADEEYDATGKLWKIYILGYHPRQVPGTDGETLFGRFFAATWDLQNEHVSLGYNSDTSGRGAMFNSEVRPQYDNVTRYSTPAGLMQIMQ
jgi:Protein of unknown function (DUF1329)